MRAQRKTEVNEPDKPALQNANHRVSTELCIVPIIENGLNLFNRSSGEGVFWPLRLKKFRFKKNNSDES